MTRYAAVLASAIVVSVVAIAAGEQPAPLSTVVQGTWSADSRDTTPYSSSHA